MTSVISALSAQKMEVNEMVQKLKRRTALKHIEDELTLNKIELDVQKLAGTSRDKYIEIVNALNANLTNAIVKGEVW